MTQRAHRLRQLLATAALLLPLSTRADVILDWNALMLDCIRVDDTAPTISTRSFAILHAAIYDAVNSITRRHQPYQFELSAPTGASVEAAAVGAAYTVISILYPSYQFWADDLYESWLAAQTPSAALTNGLVLGQVVAFMAIGSRSGDGSSLDVPYVPSDLPGQWQRTPPFFRPPLTPQWGFVESFCLPDIEPFVPGPPPALDSPEYAASFNQVKAIGAKTNAVRTAEQSQIAVFWSDFSYTATPPGHWHEIAAAIAQTRGNSLEQNARMFALLSLAQADAAIVCWEAKYRYNLWRPVTAIRRADEDANATTVPNASWDSYLSSPPFPSYTSGHSTFSKASAQVLTHFYGTDSVAFTAVSDSLPGVYRRFTSLAACADEIGMSRIYAGIHFPFDNAAGKVCGGKIGDFVSANFLISNDQLPQVRLEGFSNGVPIVRIHGRIARQCILEASSDLRAWQPISTNWAAPGGIVVADAGGSGAARRFYRARLP